MMWIEEAGVEELSIDEAYLNVTSSSKNLLWLFKLSADCIRCPFERFSPLETGINLIKISTKHKLRLRVMKDGAPDRITVVDTMWRHCPDLELNLGQFGIYDLEIPDEGGGDCDLTVSQPPVNIYLPLLAIFLSLLGLAVLSTLLTWLVKWLVAMWKEKKEKEKACEMSDFGADDDMATQVCGERKRQRVGAIDTFRGICILLMIFVNDGAGGYQFLQHATWDGLLIADLVFPWFMWVMGVCIPISIKSQLKRGVRRFSILCHIVQRSVILFLLGLMLNTVGVSPNLDNLRIPGVLQRFAVCYLVVATLGVCFTPQPYTTENRYPRSSWATAFQDITMLLPQWIVILSINAAYCYFVFFAPVPGCPSGYLGPGGIQDNLEFASCAGGMTGYIDRLALGESHMAKKSTISDTYKSIPFDPEGILGILPSTLQVMLGVQAGAILMHNSWKGRVIRWTIWGVLNAILTIILALPNIVPINKNLWSLSFVFVTTSAAYFLLIIIFIFQDQIRIWNGVPFKAPGMNPTLLYVGHTLAYNLFPFHWTLNMLPDTHFVKTLEALWGVVLWTAISYYLYFKQFFLTI